jgi:hypothetical protein
VILFPGYVDPDTSATARARNYAEQAAIIWNRNNPDDPNLVELGPP